VSEREILVRLVIVLVIAALLWLFLKQYL